MLGNRICCLQKLFCCSLVSEVWKSQLSCRKGHLQRSQFSWDSTHRVKYGYLTGCCFVSEVRPERGWNWQFRSIFMFLLTNLPGLSCFPGLDKGWRVYSWWQDWVVGVCLQLWVCVCAAPAVPDRASGCECAVCSHFMELWADCLTVALQESIFIGKMM